VTEPEELVVDKARVAGLALAAAAAASAAAWAFRARARARRRADELAAEERRAKWEAGAPERERMRREAEERRRQRHEEFLAAAKTKRWRYEIVGECHLDKRKKRFATELDARICTWVQHEKHGSSLQRAYRCDGSDAPDGDGCGAWHLTSKAAFT
jgi:hypothetical protein